MTAAMNTQSYDCLGVVLNGGQSLRMGQAKSELQRTPENTETMLQFSQRLLQDAGASQVCVSGHHGLADAVAYAGLGPAAGIASIIQQYPNARILLVVAIDMPLLHSELLLQLREHAQRHQQNCWFAQCYLPCAIVLNNATRAHWQQQLRQSSARGPSLRGLLSPGGRSLPIEIPEQLFNTNTPLQWQQAQQLLRHQQPRSAKPIQQKQGSQYV